MTTTNQADPQERAVATRRDLIRAILETHGIPLEEAVKLLLPDVLPVVACRRCGCSEWMPCEEGCWWVEDDLCSSCVEGAADEGP